jgi:general secretion pathway protein G
MKLNIKRQRSGFTLVELIVTLMIVSVLGALAMPSYRDHQDNVEMALALVDMQKIANALEVYFIDNNAYPPSLAEIGMDGYRDPYGNPYVFVGFDANTTDSDKRKDQNLNPVNSDYDLYSVGKDGDTSRNFNASNARDDIVRANDGQFYGFAEDY